MGKIGGRKIWSSFHYVLRLVIMCALCVKRSETTWKPKKCKWVLVSSCQCQDTARIATPICFIHFYVKPLLLRYLMLVLRFSFHFLERFLANLLLRRETKSSRKMALWWYCEILNNLSLLLSTVKAWQNDNNNKNTNRLHSIEPRVSARDLIIGCLHARGFSCEINVTTRNSGKLI